jgi:hypothetical protein
MKVKDKEINLDNYEFLLDFLSKNYNSFFFHELDKIGDNGLLMRHDIDYSIDSSIHIAELENRYNIKSTYFINIHSEFYNVFEKKSIKNIYNILMLGHEIGIHLDSKYWRIDNEKKLEDKLNDEKSVFDKILGFDIKTFSFHNPNDQILSFNKDKYSGLINTYSKKVMDNFKYCSDSNGYWRHEVMFDLVNSLKYDKLHLLTHPGWWMRENLQPREKIYRHLFKRSQICLEDYDENLLISKRKNIGEIPEKNFIISNFSKKKFYLIDRYWNEKNYVQILKELLIIIEKLLSKILLDKHNIDFQHYYPQDLRTFSNQNKMKLIFDLLIKVDPYYENLRKKTNELLEIGNFIHLNDNDYKNIVKNTIKLVRDLSKLN